jgi:hypothetical protein
VVVKVILTIILAGVSMISLDSETTRYFIGFVLIYFGIGASIFTLLHSHVLPFIYLRRLDIKHIEVLGTIAIYFDSLLKGNIEKYERLNCENIAKTMEISMAKAQEIIQNLKKKRLMSLNDYGDIENISKHTKKYLLKKKVL